MAPTLDLDLGTVLGVTPSSVSSSVTVSTTGSLPPPCIHNGTLDLELGTVLGVTPTSGVELGKELGVIPTLG